MLLFRRFTAVLWISMMDTVQHEVASDGILVVWHPVSLTVENKSVEGVLEKGPKDETCHECQNCFLSVSLGESHEVVGNGKGAHWDHPPWALGEVFEEPVVE